MRFNCKNLLYTKLFYKIKNKISLTTKGNNKMNILINGSGAVGLGLGASMLSQKADVSFYEKQLLQSKKTDLKGQDYSSITLLHQMNIKYMRIIKIFLKKLLIMYLYVVKQ